MTSSYRGPHHSQPSQVIRSLLLGRVVAPLVPVEVPPVFLTLRVLPHVPDLQPIGQAYGLRLQSRIVLARGIRLTWVLVALLGGARQTADC